MPDSMNVAGQTTQASENLGVFAAQPPHDGLTVLQMDEIYDRISLAEWAKFRGFEQVAIGRRSPNEPYAILLGFSDGEQLADFAMALPETANFFPAWHRDVKQTGVFDSE